MWGGVYLSSPRTFLGFPPPLGNTYVSARFLFLIFPHQGGEVVPWRELAGSQGELLVSQKSSSPGWVGPAWSPGNAENPTGDASEEGV